MARNSTVNISPLSYLVGIWFSICALSISCVRVMYSSMSVLSYGPELPIFLRPKSGWPPLHNPPLPLDSFLILELYLSNSCLTSSPLGPLPHGMNTIPLANTLRVSSSRSFDEMFNTLRSSGRSLPASSSSPPFSSSHASSYGKSSTRAIFWAISPSSDYYPARVSCYCVFITVVFHILSPTSTFCELVLSCSQLDFVSLLFGFGFKAAYQSLPPSPNSSSVTGLLRLVQVSFQDLQCYWEAPFLGHFHTIPLCTSCDDDHVMFTAANLRFGGSVGVKIPWSLHVVARSIPGEDCWQHLCD